MNYDFFDFHVPFHSELKDKYPTPVQYSKELRDLTIFIFSHPRYNKLHHRIFAENHRTADIIAMLNRAYHITRHYLDNPQHYAHDYKNVVPAIIVAMWKVWIVRRKAQGTNIDRYLTAPMQAVEPMYEQFGDMLIKDISTDKVVLEHTRKKDFRKHNEPSNPASMREEGKYWNYLVSLEEESQSSLL